ncbi:MAG: hypothetical protein HXX17_08780 [Geobacteraceae bacterium]|nr:hypothetical protein [Geobacteraceae bacterium]
MIESSNQSASALKDQGKSFYLYIGAEDDPNWRVALAACSMTTNTIPLRVDSFNTVNDMVLPPGNYVAVAFDWNGKPICFLSEEEAGNLAVVRNKITGPQA